MKLPSLEEYAESIRAKYGERGLSSHLYLAVMQGKVAYGPPSSTGKQSSDGGMK